MGGAVVGIHNNGAGEHASEDAAAQGDPRVSVALPQGAQNDSEDRLLTSLDFSLGKSMSAGIRNLTFFRDPKKETGKLPLINATKTFP